MNELQKVIEDLLRRIAELTYENSVLKIKYKTLEKELENAKDTK